MVSATMKKNLKTLFLLALVPAFCQSAAAAPQGPAEAALVNARIVRPLHSPVPPSLRSGPMLLLIRDMQQERAGGGGCWSHCFNSYNECLGLNAKNHCVSQVKTCMETCDRLSGITNPVQRQMTGGK
jgi:hypothetical protein